MRIGLITGEFPPDQGGVGDFTLRLGEALSALDHEVYVLTGIRNTQHAARSTQHATRSTLTVHRVIPDWGWGCWRRLLALARELSLDLLNVQYQAAAYGMHPAINLLPWRLRWRGRPPVVVTFHDLRVPYLFPKAGPLRWQAILALARWADGVIVTNREDELRIANCELRIWLASLSAATSSPNCRRDTTATPGGHGGDLDRTTSCWATSAS